MADLTQLVLVSTAFQSFVDDHSAPGGGVGADGVRNLMFDRGYHDEDVTDGYGACCDESCSLSQLASLTLP